MTGRVRCFERTLRFVVPAKAGTHNPWHQLLQKASAPMPKRENTAYGAPPARGRPGYRGCALPENIQRRILQPHDGLGVGDAAVRDHRERLVDRQFQDLDLLALGGKAAAATDPQAGL